MRNVGSPPLPPADRPARLPPRLSRSGSAGNPSRWTVLLPRPPASPLPPPSGRSCEDRAAPPPVRPRCDESSPATPARHVLQQLPDTASRYPETLNGVAGSSAPFDPARSTDSGTALFPRSRRSRDSPSWPTTRVVTPCRERPVHPPSFSSGPSACTCASMNPGQTIAPGRQVDHVTVSQRVADVPEAGRGDDPVLDQDVSPLDGDADAVGDHSAAEEYPSGHRLISHVPVRQARAPRTTRNLQAAALSVSRATARDQDVQQRHAAPGRTPPRTPPVPGGVAMDSD